MGRPVIISRSSDLALKNGYRLIIVSIGAFDAISTNVVDINARSPPYFGRRTGRRGDQSLVRREVKPVLNSENFYFSRSRALTLAQTHPRTTAVLIEVLDARNF